MATPIPQNRATFTPWEVAAVTSGSLTRLGSGGEPVVGLGTDSRAVTRGSGFVAIRGEAHDGHRFLAEAMDKGAALLVVARGLAPAEGEVHVVEVDDTLVAWGRLARAHLRRWRRTRSAAKPARVVAITGSAGKTTTKELCAALLAAVGPCHATLGNLNNLVGVPAVALGVDPSHRFLVAEVGMSVPGEIAKLAAIVEPDVAVLVNVGVAHAGGVGGTRADVAREKGALFEALGETGVAVANADDDAARAQLLRLGAQDARTFGRAGHADYRLLERRPLGAEGSRLVIERPTTSGGREQVEVDLRLLGEAAAIDLVAALAAAEAVAGHALSADTIRRAVISLAGIPGRARAYELGGDVVVLDDSYNANPASMRAALETLADIASASDRRMVVVLGEMRELGPFERAEHEALGVELAKAGIALAIGCGGLVDVTLEHAARGGVTVVPAKNTDEAASVVPSKIRDRDVVLLKGSRGVAVEKVFEALRQARGLAKEKSVP